MTHTASIRIRPIEAFSDNYIWLIEDGTHAVVVDPGDALPVLDELETCDLELTAILLTHHHHDHVGGVLELLQTFNAKVYGPAHETLPACDVRLGQQDQVDIAQPALSFTVLDVQATPPDILHTQEMCKASRYCFVGTLCLLEVVAGCLKARLRKCLTHWTNWPNSSPKPRSIVHMNTHWQTFAGRALLSPRTANLPHFKLNVRPHETKTNPPCLRQWG